MSFNEHMLSFDFSIEISLEHFSKTFVLNHMPIGCDHMLNEKGAFTIHNSHIGNPEVSPLHVVIPEMGLRFMPAPPSNMTTSGNHRLHQKGVFAFHTSGVRRLGNFLPLTVSHQNDNR
jgi:hypothetical protein